jgi:hypothetical protein
MSWRISKKWCGLPNIQGAIDGTHVSISKPIIIFPKDYYHHKLGDIPLLFRLASWPLWWIVIRNFLVFSLDC